MAKNVKSTVKLNMPMVRKLTAASSDFIRNDSGSYTHGCCAKSGDTKRYR